LGTVLRAWNKFVETLVRLSPTAGKRAEGDGARPGGPRVASA